MRKHLPLISVILPTYNRAYPILRAIESVKAQTYPYWELVIIDDGSTDETAEVLERVTKLDTRIRTYRQRNLGPARARNHGVARAQGEIIAFIDSDDQYDPCHLELGARTFCASEKTDFIITGVRIIGDPKVPDRTKKHKFYDLRDPDVAITGTFMLRRDKLIEMGGFPNLKYSEDRAFLTKARNFGLQVLRLDRPTYYYSRLEKDSITSLFLQSLRPRSRKKSAIPRHTGV